MASIIPDSELKSIKSDATGLQSTFMNVQITSPK